MQEMGAKGLPDFEHEPLTRPEYIAAMVHLYRGEMHRALTWRTRLDTTTNWAIVTSGVMLSLVFSDQSPELHVVGILAILIVFFMLCYEARRFRYFDIWRSRVRKLEENFYVPLLRRDMTSPVENWGFLVAEDLLTPRFKIGYFVAMRARLIRNYIPVFIVLFGAWTAKLMIHARVVPDPTRSEGTKVLSAETFEEAFAHSGVGPIPSWLVIAFVGGLGLYLLAVGLLCRPPRTAETIWWSSRSDESVDEIS
jgi:uncharacterized membrane protein